MPKSIENIPLLDDQKKKQYTFTLWQKYTSCRWQVGITAALAMSCSILLRLNMTMVVVCMTPGNLTLAVSQNGTEITIRDPYLPLPGPSNTSFDRHSNGAFCPDEGGLEPCGTQLLSNWAPLHERAQMMSITEQANSIGGIGNFILSGFICNIPVLGGWPFIFYIFSGINMVAMILWLFLVYDKPSKHPWIKPAEVDYINSHRTKSHDKPLVVPWFKMMTSGPVWACVLGYVTSGTLFMVMAVCLPLYIEQVLKFDVATNGLVSALAFVGRFLGALVFGYLSDWIFTKRLLSLITIRKTCHATGLLGSIPIILGISFLGQDDQRLAVVLMTLYWFTLTCMNSGFRVNPADIAPRFAGVICGMCVFLNSVVSLFVPMVVTALTPNGTADEWQIVFYGCVGVSVVGTVVFLVLASAKEQEWAKDPEMDKDVVIKVTGSNNHAFDVDSVCSQNSSYSFK
ncbi:sodium-dependent phosphate transport protein 4-like isoform X2 [Mizuhopecten yessoensis]|uniref:sodium-dependent phosphate transport protein 4-like isoform X2 n=1 Tax=Mizuhopecten yessoensis TaxID=6573 RepID=UPI000B4573A3|nr:sodium-dependent phosphate transport protein 4-like isoform X2 [Mizuhopecten yessoensis]